MKNLGLSLFFLVICISCSDNPGTNSSDTSKKFTTMCLTKGANLYLKCADGRENVFGLGYGDKLSVRRKGTFTLKAAQEFCDGNKPSEINFWLTGGHFQVQGLKEWGLHLIMPWQTEQNACARVNHDSLVNYDTLIIKTLPITEPVPKNEEL